MEHNPRDPNVEKAYESFIKQTITQYKHELKAFFLNILNTNLQKSN
jgi:hypothetical protein